MEKRALPYIQGELQRLHSNNAQMLADESEFEFLKVAQRANCGLISPKIRAIMFETLFTLFLKVCQQLPEYGILFYRVMREKKPQEGEIILGVCAKGVIVYEIKDSCRSTSQNFYWRETATISSNVSRMTVLSFISCLHHVSSFDVQ